MVSFGTLKVLFVPLEWSALWCNSVWEGGGAGIYTMWRSVENSLNMKYLVKTKIVNMIFLNSK